MQQTPSAESTALPDLPPTPSPPKTALWFMLLALLSAFALSQAYRTVTAIMATGLRHDFGLTPASLGAFAGLFGLSFGVAQFFMGIGMDVVGLRRTVLSAFPLTIVGAALSAWAPGYPWLMLGQLLIGVGCAPAFLACTVFIARHFPSARFAFVSGIAMGVGGLGLLFTGTPLAWLVQRAGWRSGFVLLAVLSALAWLLIWRRVHEPALAGPPPEREHWRTAVRRFGALFVLPHTLGILLLGMVAYASFLALRGLWIGPMLIERYGFTLVGAGNMAVAMSLISLFSPALFGRIDPGPTRRRRWVVNFSLGISVLYLGVGLAQQVVLNLALVLAISVLSGYSVLLYSDVRSSYPSDLTGRALSVFTMAMFLGVGLMQSLTGWVAGWAQGHGVEPYRAVMTTIAVALALGSTAFRYLPESPLLHQHSPQEAGHGKN
ncbi:MFS transporter [Simplicispira hankyongi]|uniref:MFS transporter n=1 Tax=Simplicispira hankyongi TaxID=2315688 RepID=A0A398CJF1_9BURK|nr:MFS transporter [Simplicispira hankyongi]RIE00007.1 MFS transporter [Simplicispira hankyongi]